MEPTGSGTCLNGKIKFNFEKQEHEQRWYPFTDIPFYISQLQTIRRSEFVVKEHIGSS